MENDAAKQVEEEVLDKHWPAEFRKCEREAITTRRTIAGGNSDSATADYVGIACSGGGIRSATFSLGFFQSLAREGLLKRIDYLSTVSGGGYFGGFLGGLYARYNDGAAANTQTARVERTLGDSRSFPIQWLRENGRYLAPNGSGDVLTSTGLLLRNWVSIQLILGLFFLQFFLLASLIQSLFHYWTRTLPEPFEFLTTHGNVQTVHEFWPSPYLGLFVALGLLCVVPLGWAYWLVPEKDMRPRIKGYAGHAIVIIALASIGIAFRYKLADISTGTVEWSDQLPWLLLVSVPIAAEIYYGIGRWRSRTHLQDCNAFLRNRLSDWLGWALLATFVVLVFGIVDTCGQTLAMVPHSDWGPLRLSIATSAVGTLGALVGYSRKIAAVFGIGADKGLRLGRSVDLILHLVAFLLVFLFLTLVSVLAHTIAGRTANHYPDLLERSGVGLIALVLTLSASFLVARILPFVNRSSYQSFYEARLVRAYLGASNSKRRDATERDVTQVVDGDAIAMADYSPYKQGGPLHFVNVTFNETVDGRSNVEQRDRKGIGVAVGPFGLSAGIQHHALWGERRGTTFTPCAPAPGTFRVFEQSNGEPIRPELVDVGKWLAISGAAFSTGLGARTSLGLSLLCGIGNVRLGYWWNSGVNPAWREAKKACATSPIRTVGRILRSIFPVQFFLMDEFTARFHGPANQHWNLSDGGHFENLGGYELLRRQVPFIVLIDAEQDADFTFTGLANLVRKARVDFQAEFQFFKHQELQSILDDSVRVMFGPLVKLRPAPPDKAKPGGRPWSSAHAALARVNYPNGKTSTVVYVKPTLIGEEPVDLIQYQSQNPTFPHETTSDQFFDEAQWESYRKLGEHIGRALFATTPNTSKWSPRNLTPLREVDLAPH